ncbi:hypothetical protein HJC23_011664 [Cyclotella cryptica]|uniref:Uncharacterized protein n=1 Tax=Cyclotella cryptica TaxID=29204 RepID=A0ABD3NT34_9STRA
MKDFGAAEFGMGRVTSIQCLFFAIRVRLLVVPVVIATTTTLDHLGQRHDPRSTSYGPAWTPEDNSALLEHETLSQKQASMKDRRWARWTHNRGGWEGSIVWRKHNSDDADFRVGILVIAS